MKNGSFKAIRPLFKDIFHIFYHDIMAKVTNLGSHENQPKPPMPQDPWEPMQGSRAASPQLISLFKDISIYVTMTSGYFTIV